MLKPIQPAVLQPLEFSSQGCFVFTRHCLPRSICHCSLAFYKCGGAQGPRLEGAHLHLLATASLKQTSRGWPVIPD